MPCAASRIVRAEATPSYEVCFLDAPLLIDPAPLQRHLQRRRSLLVTTPTVARRYGHQLMDSMRAVGAQIDLLALSCDETTKSMAQVNRICKAALVQDLDRRGVLISMGGGICTDLVTVAASMIRRGIGHVRIPTTLIGQVDAGVGIKGAVNYQSKKSYLGCFHAPELVLIDPTSLPTLAERHLLGGLAEIVKMAVVADPELFATVERHGPALIESRFQGPESVPLEVVQRSALRMIEALESNLFEDQTYQRAVDFGHTFSPALESASGFTLLHGEAVAIDIALSCTLAHELGLLDATTCTRIIDTLRAVGLPVYHPYLTQRFCETAMLEIRRHRGGSLNMVLPTGVGSYSFPADADLASAAALQAAIRRLAASGQPLRSSSSTAGAMQQYLVFDVGGTHLRAARYDAAENSLSHFASRPTASHRDLPPGTTQEAISRNLLQDMQRLAQEVLQGQTPRAVTVAFAGPIDPAGRVLGAPTIWGATQQQPVDLLSALSELWPSTPVLMLNDVAAAGYRYIRSAQEDFCIITVGSGIGNKVFLGGHPVTGPAGRGGEIGHIRVDHSPDALPCDCGGHGHLGGIASGRGALLVAQRLAMAEPQRFSRSMPAQQGCADPADLHNEALVQAFLAGDPWTEDLIRQVARPLGQMLASLHLAIGLERFVIFGGFALALGEGYRQELVQAAAASGWDVGQDWNRMVELGVPDGQSGMIGAGRYAALFAQHEADGGFDDARASHHVVSQSSADDLR